MIPHELIEIDAWVVWRYEWREGSVKPTKVPYHPEFGIRVAVEDPSNWVSHAKTINGHAQSYNGNGFCVAPSNPYTFIDLDDPYMRTNGSLITEKDGVEWIEAKSIEASHWEIVQAFASYTEWSPSGRGLHIIVRGKVPDNRKKAKVEIYSHSRYMTMTGQHVAGTPATIEDRQGLLDALAERLGTGSGEILHESQPQTQDDNALLQNAMTAANGEKFLALWSGHAGNKSEEDLALANIIAFYTDNHEQAERVFRLSPHFQNRPKLHGAHGDYLVKRAVRLGFDQKAPPIDASGLIDQLARYRDDSVDETTPEEHGITDDALRQPPPGVLGEITEYLYRSAPRPVKEVALVGAIGLMAGICGRAFNINGTGLNQYVVLLGSSGIGKEGMSSGIARLLSYLTDTIPSAAHFVGSSHFSSAQALYKAFGTGQQGKSPSFVSLLPEIGEWLAVHTSPKAQSNEKLLIRAFMDLWAKSGKTDVSQGMSYSDSDKYVAAIKAPAFSFAGDSVPDSFFAACTGDSIKKGLIPRFLIIEYTGKRPRLNKLAFEHKPSYDFISRLKMIVEQSLQRNNMNTPIDVGYTTEAFEFLDEFNEFCDRQWNDAVNSPGMEVRRAIWNRSHLKCLKLAALLAVGVNWLEPKITIEQAQYAKAFVLADAYRLLARIDRGEISTGSIHNDRHRAMLKYFAGYLKKKPAPSNNIPDSYYKAGILPHSYLMKVCKMNKLFRSEINHRTDTQTIVQVLRDMSEAGLIRNVKTDLGYLGKFGIAGPLLIDAYIITDVSVLKSAEDPLNDNPIFAGLKE